MNSLKRLYIAYPIDRPILTIIIVLTLSAFLALGIKWIVIDDDFVKMFPDDITSKEIWDEIQNEFGSTEYLIAAIEHDNILDDSKFYDKIFNFSNKLKQVKDSNGKEMINRVLSITELDVFSEQKKEKISEYDQIIKNRFIKNNFLSIAIIPENNINNAELVSEVKKNYQSVLGEYKCHFAGQPYLTGETPNLIKKDIRVLMLVGISIMIVVLLVNLRSIYAVMCVLCVIFLSLMGMVGFMGWLFRITGDNIFNFTILSTSMPILLLTIANSDGVHISTRFSR